MLSSSQKRRLRARRSQNRPNSIQGYTAGQQVSTKPMTMREIPPSWNLAQMDANPMPRPRRQQTCTFQRTYTAANLSANTGDTLYAFNFALNSLPNYTEFTSLFDQYRILEAIVSFVPYSTTSSSSTEASAFPGIIGTWIDYDDSNLPANLQEGQQYDTYQKSNATASFSRVVKPRSAVASYSGTFTSYDNIYGQWHDANSPGVQHYGLKLCITGSTFATSTSIYHVEVTVTLQTRSQH